jgi:hypothetical protein
VVHFFSFIHRSQKLLQPCSAFYCPPTENPGTTSFALFCRIYSSSPSPLSMYFDRISFHCRYNPYQRSSSNTPRRNLRLCLYYPRFYPLRCHMPCFPISPDSSSHCRFSINVHLESECRRKHNPEEDIVFPEEEAESKFLSVIHSLITLLSCRFNLLGGRGREWCDLLVERATGSRLQLNGSASSKSFQSTLVIFTYHCKFCSCTRECVGSVKSGRSYVKSFRCRASSFRFCGLFRITC